ncbi:unnamed protein product [Arabidopsis halleri]
MASPDRNLTQKIAKILNETRTSYATHNRKLKELAIIRSNYLPLNPTRRLKLLVPMFEEIKESNEPISEDDGQSRSAKLLVPISLHLLEKSSAIRLLRRIRSSITRKAYTSDDELSSPLAVVVLQQEGSKKINNGGADVIVRYQLLRECWMNGE